MFLTQDKVMKLKPIITILEATLTPISYGEDWYRFQIDGTKKGLELFSAFTDYFELFGYKFITPNMLLSVGVTPEILYKTGITINYDDPTQVVRGAAGSHHKDDWVGRKGADDFPND